MFMFLLHPCTKPKAPHTHVGKQLWQQLMAVAADWMPPSGTPHLGPLRAGTFTCAVGAYGLNSNYLQRSRPAVHATFFLLALLTSLPANASRMRRTLSNFGGLRVALKNADGKLPLLDTLRALSASAAQP